MTCIIINDRTRNTGAAVAARGIRKNRMDKEGESIMKIAMGNDHTAIELKNIIKEFVESKGYEVIDLGTNSTESCD